MFHKHAKKMIVMLMAATASFIGCSESESVSEPIVQKDVVFPKNESANMWAKIQQNGVSEYFETAAKEGKTVVASSPFSAGHCDAPALKMDENTRYFDELESLFDEGELVDGVCGKALKLNDGQVAPLGVNLIDSMRVGTAEFWFKPNEDFLDKPRTLFGNDGARLHFFYKDGEIFFQKNHHNLHYYARGKVTLKNDWNLIAGQWGDGYMSIWVNGEMVALLRHDKGYVPANRGKPFENLLVIGYKSSCCMEGPGQYAAMTTSGSFDQIRISNIPRYKVVDKKDDQDTILPIDSLAYKEDMALKDSLKKELADKPKVTIEEQINGDSLKAVEKQITLSDSSMVWVKVEMQCCRNSEDIAKKEIKDSLVATPAKD